MTSNCSTKYDRWANGRVFQTASALSAEQFTRNLRGSFPSVRDTLVHILSGEWGWLEFWKEPSPSPAFLMDLVKRLATLFPSGFISERRAGAAKVDGSRKRTRGVRK
jgi:hypothetical protein